MIYENVCLKCNPEAGDGKEVKEPKAACPSIYTGESSRSICERGAEHERDFKDSKEDSHMYKHEVVHRGTKEPKFHLRVVGFHRTALGRQIAEAVRIRRRGTSTLNSKMEYNRCAITRLSLPEDGTLQEPPHQDGSEGSDGIDNWMEEEAGRQRDGESQDLMNTYGSVGMENPAKRKDTLPDQGRRRKKWKCMPVAEDWGTKSAEEGSPEGTEPTPDGTEPKQKKAPVEPHQSQRKAD